MKLRHPLVISLAARLIARFVRVWIGSLRYTYRPLGPALDPRAPDFRGRYLYAFWHENILLPAYLFGPARNIHVLISRHADGQLIAEVAERLGFRAIRGSSTRGGAEAVLEMLKARDAGHLAVTPDGPRGPRREVQPGVAYLASRTGLPVVPFGVAFDRPRRARSWDRFAVPRPFRRAVIVTGEPLVIPPGVAKDGLEPHRRRIQDELDRLTALAEAAFVPFHGAARAAA
jgi:hypothetical protein